VVLACSLTLCVPAGEMAAQSQGLPPDPNRPVSVLVLDFAGDGYQLTSPADGVPFDIDGTGQRLQVGWTARGADDGFLFLDTNSNGRVDNGRELLGNGWRLPDGSRSPSVDGTLTVIQGHPYPPTNPLPDGSWQIDGRDAVFERLRVWRDVNHDGQSQPNELQPLAEAQILEILLSFRNLRRSVDESANIRQYEGTFMVSRQGVRVTRRMLDVVLARKP